MGGSGLIASGLTFIVLALAGRNLNLEDFGDFAAVWGLLFGGASVLSVFELEAARRAAADTEHQYLGALLPIAIATSVVAGSLSLIAIPLLARVFAVEHRSALVAVPIAFALYPAYYVTRGWLAGGGHLGGYALASLLEGLLRPIALVILGATSTQHYTWAAACGGIAWAPWAARVVKSQRQQREERDPRIAISYPETLKNLGALMSGQVAGALLITGFPATMTLVLGDFDPVGLATAVALVSVSRLPLLMLSSVYGLLVPWFSRTGSSPGMPSSAKRWVPKGLIAAIPLMIVGGFIVSFGADVLLKGEADAGVFVSALFLVGATLLGLLQIMIAQLVARSQHGFVQRVWWTAAGTAVLCLGIIGRIAVVPAQISVGIALMIGPLAGLAVALQAPREGARAR